jgi:hypothetical protein
MKKITIFIIVFINSLIVMNAQIWEVKSYTDEWGDLSGKRSIKQKVEGSIETLAQVGLEVKIIVEISRDVPSTNDFIIKTYSLNGTPWEYLDSKDRIVNKSVELEKGKYLFRYKIGKKESSFYISNPNTLRSGSSNSNVINVNYSELNAILLSTSVPIKCIIAVESPINEGSFVNLIRFTLYPSNYMQVGH